jgi:hypothetical protein
MMNGRRMLNLLKEFLYKKEWEKNNVAFARQKHMMRTSTMISGPG